MSASEKLKVLDGKFELLRIGDAPAPVIELLFWPQIVAVVEDGENAIEQALLFVERHIEEDHAKPLRAVLRTALARFSALEEALS